MAVHFPVGIQARFEESQAVGGKGRIIGNAKMIRRYPKSPGVSSIGAPCGVRSAAWSQASR